ncbi:glycoside hydrolase family 9 protein [Actinopolymorpha pittospori]
MPHRARRPEIRATLHRVVALCVLTALPLTALTACFGSAAEARPSAASGRAQLSPEGGDPIARGTGPRVRVNQVGYLPRGPKNATVVSAATEPLTWQLRGAAGQVVARGKSTPRGLDPASGQRVQTIDFGSFERPGSRYTLTADGATSYPFDISDHVYDGLRSDALKFFYIQRSGIPIESSLVGARYARPAGHVGVPPNTDDADVPCQKGVCDYRLDVRGGWYDAADQGKYVVNGGIAASQLLSTWERTSHAPGDQTKAFADGSLRVPEHGNATPDILDEARWELAFLLRMQVPPGLPLAGMAHHKIHDRAWTPLPTSPQDDPQPRELHRPSTAATLNLAAAGAQCARVFKPFDHAFADRCLSAAKTAWTAAKAHPKIYASDSDAGGGGAYGDRDVDDEFYWAAAELYLTTGQQTYLDAVRSSPLHRADVFAPGGFGWQSVGALGRLDLASVPSRLPAAERRLARGSVIAAADTYLARQRQQAYGVPMRNDAASYAWGSNANILNNLVVIATAYDLTGRAGYRDGALRGMDYVLGRNGLNNSYVTGYGEHSSQNQHSRIFAHQLDPKRPHPPTGTMAGGANAALQDPVVQKRLAGCRPQLCYLDDIRSFATNEYAINWNSALTWMVSFAADQGSADHATPGQVAAGHGTARS